MKTRNKIGALSVLAATAILNPWSVKAESSTLPSPVDGKITLTEDVSLNSAWVNNNTGKVTIDLNGHTLKRAGYYGYLINNNSKDDDLVITDSSADKKGMIVCEKENDPRAEKSPSSCIRNNGTLEINGVTIDSEFHGIKTEEDTTLTVKNSKITTHSIKASGIQNYGDLTLESSEIYGATDPQGAAIFSLSWNEGGVAYGSTATIKDSTLSAYWPIIIEHFGTSIPGETIDVVVENSTLEQIGGLARIEGRNKRSTNDVSEMTLTLKGNITASSEALEFAEEGTVLTLNKDLTEEITVPKGMTLVIPEGITVGENVRMEEGATVENKSTGEITITIIGEDGTEETKTIPEGKDSSYVEPTPEDPENPTEPTEPTNPTDPENPTEPTTPEEPKKDDDINTPNDNPKTLDGVYGYAAIGAVSLASLVAIIKKKLS